MLIYGYRTKTKTLGQVEYHCSKDGRATVHTAIASTDEIDPVFQSPVSVENDLRNHVQHLRAEVTGGKRPGRTT